MVGSVEASLFGSAMADAMIVGGKWKIATSRDRRGLKICLCRSESKLWQLPL
jgi:hypothetical protein